MSKLARKPTCPKCGLTVEDKQPTKKIKGKTYHLSCYQEMIEEEYGTKVNTDTEGQTDKQILYEYIKQLYVLDEVTAMIDKQVEKYCVDYKLTYMDIKSILEYYYVTCENSVVSDGIGIIPFILHEAKKHFTTVEKAQQINKSLVNTIKPTSEAKSNRVVYKRRDSDLKKKIINIEDL